MTRFAIQLECCSGETTAALHSWLEHSFAAVYLVFRIFIGPVCSVHVTYDLLTKRGRTNVPLLLSLVWVGMVWAVLWGSIPFIEEAMEMLRDGWKLKYHADFDFGERFRILKEEL